MMLVYFLPGEFMKSTQDLSRILKTIEKLLWLTRGHAWGALVIAQAVYLSRFKPQERLAQPHHHQTEFRERKTYFHPGGFLCL